MAAGDEDEDEDEDNEDNENDRKKAELDSLGMRRMRRTRKYEGISHRDGWWKNRRKFDEIFENLNDELFWDGTPLDPPENDEPKVSNMIIDVILHPEAIITAFNTDILIEDSAHIIRSLGNGRYELINVLHFPRGTIGSTNSPH